jgi:hypothetical protein
MSELTDLEINKRLAEIEGLEFWVHENIAIMIGSCWDSQEYNPLTDDGLCLRLIFEYGVQINKVDPILMSAQCEHDVVMYSVLDMPNKAACLAIIASKS